MLLLLMLSTIAVVHGHLSLVGQVAGHGHLALEAAVAALHLGAAGVEGGHRPAEGHLVGKAVGLGAGVVHHGVEAPVVRRPRSWRWGSTARKSRVTSSLASTANFEAV